MDALSSKLSTHRLEGRALKRWWQVDGFFSIAQKKPMEDKFSNGAIRSQLMFFMLLPFATALYCYVNINTPSAMTPRLLLLAVVAAVFFIHFVLTARRHLNRIVEVQVSEIGLDLKSPFLKRSIRWDQIRDFYKNQDGDYMLDTTSGDEFILSNELTNSDQLFDFINRRAPKPSTKFSFNYHARSDLVDSASMACFAVIVACSTYFFASYASIDERIQAYAIAAGGILLSAIWWRLQLTRVACLTRVGDQSFYIRTRTGSREIRWEELTNVKQRGVLFYVKARSTGWFVILADKEGPVSAPLIEFQQNRKLLKQGRT